MALQRRQAGILSGGTVQDQGHAGGRRCPPPQWEATAAGACP
jgi:hypothetical protein